MNTRLSWVMPLERNELSASSRSLLASGLPDPDAVDHSVDQIERILLNYETDDDLGKLSYQLDEHDEDVQTLARESAGCLVLMTDLIVRLSSYRQQAHIAKYDLTDSVKVLEDLVPLADAMRELRESDTETQKVLGQIDTALSERNTRIKSDEMDYHWRITNLLLPETFAHAVLTRDRKATSNDTAKSLVKDDMTADSETFELPDHVWQVHRVHRALYDRRQRVMETLIKVREYDRSSQWIQHAAALELELTQYVGDTSFTAEAEEALMIALTGPWLSFKEPDEDDMKTPFMEHDKASQLEDEHAVVLRIIDETEKSTGSTATLQAAMDYAESDACKQILHEDFAPLHERWQRYMGDRYGRRHREAERQNPVPSHSLMV